MYKRFFLFVLPFILFVGGILIGPRPGLGFWRVIFGVFFGLVIVLILDLTYRSKGIDRWALAKQNKWDRFCLIGEAFLIQGYFGLSVLLPFTHIFHNEIVVILMVLIGAAVSFAGELKCRSKGFNRWAMAKQSGRNISFVIVVSFLWEWSFGAFGLYFWKKANLYGGDYYPWMIIDNTEWIWYISLGFCIIYLILENYLPTQDFKEKMGIKKRRSIWEEHFWNGEEDD